MPLNLALENSIKDPKKIILQTKENKYLCRKAYVMSDENKPEKFTLNYKIWLSSENGKGIMGDGKWQILKAIEKHGSLKAATEALGLTYRRTWGDLKQIEKDLGYPLLEKKRGGKHGGETTLTDQGVRLVKAFDKFHKKTDRFMEKAFTELEKNLLFQ